MGECRGSFQKAGIEINEKLSPIHRIMIRDFFLHFKLKREKSVNIFVERAKIKKKSPLFIFVS